VFHFTNELSQQKLHILLRLPLSGPGKFPLDKLCASAMLCHRL